MQMVTRSVSEGAGWWYP